MHDVDRRVRHRQRLRGALVDGDVRQPAGAPAGQRDQVGVRLDADDRARRSRRTTAGGSRCRSRRRARSRPAQRRDGPHGGLDRAVGVDRVVLDLVRRGVVPDVGARPSPGRDAAQSRTSPFGVWTCAARMPGVPLGATHSTFTSSSGASTVSPSHSLTRCGSPAISRQARENAVVGARARVHLGRALPLDEERQLRVGDQAVDADLLPLQARCRRGGAGCRSRPRGRAAARRR